MTEPQFFTLSSTDGDFDLDSEFRPVPGSFLKFSLERSGIVPVSAKVMIQGDVQVWLLIDGLQAFCWSAEQNFETPFSVDLTSTFHLPAGAHELGISAKSRSSTGPRDWSPRWEKEGKPYGKLIRSQVYPLVITAVVKDYHRGWE